MRTTLVVPPFDCLGKINWFDDFASIHFRVYVGAYTAKFANDLTVIKFGDHCTQVKNNEIVHLGSLKGDRVR